MTMFGFTNDTTEIEQVRRQARLVDAVGGAIVDAEAFLLGERVDTGDEAAVFPPVSGGCEMTHAAISEEPIDYSMLVELVTEPGAAINSIKCHLPTGAIIFRYFNDLSDVTIVECRQRCTIKPGSGVGML